MLASGLTLFLASCGTPGQMEAPRPAAAGVSELAKSVCNIWSGSQPTWADADTERTKDEIDYSYRVQEATCGPIQGVQ